MTWNSKPLKIPKPKPSKIIQPEDLAGDSEDSQQMALFAWAALNTTQYPQLKNLFAIPNGGDRHIVEAIKFMGTGTRSGVPDICLAWAINDWDDFRLNYCKYHALYIELKIEKYRNHKNGGCSKEQLDWHERLRKADYCVKVCYGWEEGRDCLINYLEVRL